MEGRKRMDRMNYQGESRINWLPLLTAGYANCIRYDHIEDNPTIDLMDAHQEERKFGRRVQDWYNEDGR